MKQDYGMVSAAAAATTVNSVVRPQLFDRLLDAGHFVSYTPDGPIEVIVARARENRLGFCTYMAERFLLDRDGYVTELKRAHYRDGVLAGGEWGFRARLDPESAALAIDSFTCQPVLVHVARMNGQSLMAPCDRFYFKPTYVPPDDAWAFAYAPGFLPLRNSDALPLPRARFLLSAYKP